MKPSKAVLFTISLLPLAILIYRGVTGHLGANPVEFVIRNLGDWGLRFLLITLAVTPLRIIMKNGNLAQYRRMLGLFAFFYAALHLLTFFVADLSGSFPRLWQEVVKHPFITAGMAAFLILVPLAATSANSIIKRLGAARWKAIHKGIYVAAPLAVLHFYWMVKADKREPLIYASVLAVLLLFRLYRRYFRREALQR
jgi:sulfoxide reductase heme-binding subunit YedZ